MMGWVVGIGIALLFMGPSICLFVMVHLLHNQIGMCWERIWTLESRVYRRYSDVWVDDDVGDTR